MSEDTVNINGNLTINGTSISTDEPALNLTEFPVPLEIDMDIPSAS